jgi:effector-binding domain-containing protein
MIKENKEIIQMKVETTNMKSQIAVAIKKTAVNMDSMMAVINEDVEKLMAYLSEHGKQLVGAPYLAYKNPNEDWSQFDIEWGVPIDEAIPVKGEFFMSQSYEGKALTVTHKGAYKDLEKAYNALMDYAKENSLESTGIYYDYYLNDPSDTPESELLTQVVYPIK